MNESQTAQGPAWTGPGHREFVILIGLLMASNALAIDIMLPALPQIGEALGVHPENRRQLVVTIFLIGFGGAQLLYGPLADHFGRKRLLTFSMLLYAVAAIISAVSQSFTLLLAARLLHGVAAAGSRVLVASIVRDRFQGAEMARIMSFAMMVFLLIPILAPSLGQAILVAGDWRVIFIVLGAYAALILSWAGLRLPETLPPDRRRPLSFAKVGAAVALILSNRLSIGNTLAAGLLFGALFGFINSVQQIVFDTFHAGAHFGLLFGASAATMAVTSYLNSRIVMAFGTRRILLGGLTAFVLLTGLHFVLNEISGETLWRFMILQACSLACYGLITGNLTSIAMHPLGHIAGTASAVQGTITTFGGALIGFAIGQAFDGTPQPLVGASFLLGTIALLLALWANRIPHEVQMEKGAV